jgi:hypothetical protein
MMMIHFMFDALVGKIYFGPSKGVSGKMKWPLLTLISLSTFSLLSLQSGVFFPQKGFSFGSDIFHAALNNKTKKIDGKFLHTPIASKMWV